MKRIATIAMIVTIQREMIALLSQSVDLEFLLNQGLQYVQIVG